jgi:hypothetical protein
MKRQLTDKQIDKMMSAIVADASADDALIDEIVASPTLWWSVRREIGRQAEAAATPWPPVNAIRRWLLVAVPAFAAAAVIIGIFVFRPNTVTTETAGLQQDGPASATVVSPEIVPERALPVKTSDSGKTAVSVKATAPVRAARARTARPVDTNTTAVAAAVEKPVFKSEFIALTYARNPESGQMVRVKVPSAMMVTLGLVSSVEKPTSMVDAEVIVGDDGQTHAIRFIR